MGRKVIFTLSFFIVCCTERLFGFFDIGFFDFYPARMLFLFFLLFFSHKQFYFYASKETKAILKLFFIYLFFSFLSVFKSPDIIYSLKKWLDLFTLYSFIFLFYAFMSKYFSDWDIEKIYKLFISNFKWIIIIVFLAELFLAPYREDIRTILGFEFVRKSSFFMDPNFLSSFWVVCFFIILFSKVNFKYVFLSIIFIGIILTGSKGGFFAFILTCFLYYRKRIPGLNSRLFIYIIFLSISVCILTVILYPAKSIDYILNLPFYDNGMGFANLLPRLLVWSSGALIFIQNPLLGIGWGNIVTMEKSSTIQNLIDYINGLGIGGLGNEAIDTLATHSIFLETLYEGGILSFIFWLAFIWKILKYFLEYSNLNPQYFRGYTLAYISFYLTILTLSYNAYFLSFLTGLFLFLIDTYRKNHVYTSIEHYRSSI